MVVDRSLQPVNADSSRSGWHTRDEIDEQTMDLEESMLFLINEKGKTKVVKERHWGRNIRRVNEIEVQSDD